MSKAIAIIPGFRARMGEYLSGMQEGYYDHILLMPERSDKPFAFITRHPVPSACGLRITQTPYAKDAVSNPSMFADSDVFLSTARGKFGQFAVVKATHLQRFGIDPDKMQVFIPERLGDVYTLSGQGDMLSLVKSPRASLFLQSALGLIETTPLDFSLSPVKPAPAP